MHWSQGESRGVVDTRLLNIAPNHSARGEAQNANQKEQPTGGFCECVRYLAGAFGAEVSRVRERLSVREDGSIVEAA